MSSTRVALATEWLAGNSTHRMAALPTAMVVDATNTNIWARSVSEQDHTFECRPEGKVEWPLLAGHCLTAIGSTQPGAALQRMAAERPVAGVQQTLDIPDA